MNRIRSQREAEVVQAALDMLPGELPRMLSHVHYFFGDPIFAGLHAYGNVDPSVIDQEVSYRDVAHFCDPEMLFRLPKSRRHPTMILPSHFLTTYADPVHSIVHELGHALHSLIEHTWVVGQHVTSYAEVNDWEAFAEFFVTWIVPFGSYGERRLWVDPEAMAYDLPTLWLFERLSEGWLP